MGIPSFFKWLRNKYPQIVSDYIEDKEQSVSEYIQIPVDTILPNPNKMEFDNLYLDMNSIIHPCTHPENKPAPKDEDEMFHEIFMYIDRIFSIVRPRKLIYMAVDGVAPRAKMNQQRSRRFRASKKTKEKHSEIDEKRSELSKKGARLPDPKEPSECFDSNCITPGTLFMARLTIALQYYIYYKLESDPEWKNIQVIFSDASVPGEGEHKIIDYIRCQRVSPTHDPNTKHCLCGVDADLIMLGLATHERHFTIIREKFKPFQSKSCEVCYQNGHSMSKCTGLANTEINTVTNNIVGKTEFIFIHLNILREYLQQELDMPNLRFPYDFERAVDDWVFMCFFMGNDFLPHLPSLEILEKVVDRLIEIYKSSVRKIDGWLTDSGKVNISGIKFIMKDLASLENEIFTSKTNVLIQPKYPKFNDNISLNQHATDSDNLSSEKKFSVEYNKSIPTVESKSSSVNSNENQNVRKDTSNLPAKRKFEENEENLKVEGYRTHYYQSKFGISVEENPEFCVNVAHQYLRGLCWELAYYYRGCVSWTWYYPYHYAPFAADFDNLSEADVEFEKNTKPFNPFEQLIGIFPADSKSHVPSAWQDLMTDPKSPVIDLYPTNFKIDMNDKYYDWKGVSLLPFVDEERLLKILKERYPLLTEEEKERNVIGSDKYFVRFDHPVADVIKFIYELDDTNDSVIDPKLTSGVTGRIWKDVKAYQPGNTVKCPIKGFFKDIENVKVVSCFYKNSQYSED